MTLYTLSDGSYIKEGKHIYNDIFNPVIFDDWGGLFYCDQKNLFKWLDKFLLSCHWGQVYISTLHLESDSKYSYVNVNESNYPYHLNLNITRNNNEIKWYKTCYFTKNKTDKYHVDRTQTLEDFFVSNPQLHLIAMKQCGNALKYIPEQTNELCMEAIKQNLIAIKYIKNYYFDVSICAVRLASKLKIGIIEYIKNYTKDISSDEFQQICDEAIKLDPENNYSALQFIENQPYDICLKLVRINYITLQYIKNQTPEMLIEIITKHPWAIQYVNDKIIECNTDLYKKLCMIAVTKNGRTLQYVKNQTPDICKTAVNQIWDAIEFIEDKTSESFINLCLETITKNGQALIYLKNHQIKNFSDICLEAIKRKPSIMLYVKQMELEDFDNICYKAIMNDGTNLKYISDPPHELCLSAVRKNGMNLQFINLDKIKNKSIEDYEEICFTAINQDGRSLKFIKNPSQNMITEAFRRNCKATNI
jgi:hypothetical protein